MNKVLIQFPCISWILSDYQYGVNHARRIFPRQENPSRKAYRGTQKSLHDTNFQHFTYYEWARPSRVIIIIEWLSLHLRVRMRGVKSYIHIIRLQVWGLWKLCARCDHNAHSSHKSDPTWTGTPPIYMIMGKITDKNIKLFPPVLILLQTCDGNYEEWILIRHGSTVL